MRAGTHLAFAGLIGVGAAGFGADVGLGFGGALALGAVLPDIDTRRSAAGRLIPPLARLLERRFGHRTLTHSLLGLAGAALLASPLLLGQRSLWAALLTGYGSHLLLDTANVSGVPLLWPLRVRFWLVGNRGWRVAYASPRESVWFAAIAVTALALAPLTRDGFTPWFHRALGTSYGAVEDYLRWKDEYEVWAEVRGSNLVTGERVATRFRVVDALHTERILVEDDTGGAYAVGLGQTADITATRVRVWPGAPIETRSERIDPAGGTLGDLLAGLPGGAARVHVTGALHTPDPVEPDRQVGRYRRVRRSGDALELRSATPAELAPLAWLWIESGSVIVRIDHPAGARPTPPTPPPARTRAGERITLRLSALPGLDAVRVAAGDRIEVGDLLALYPAGAETDLRRRALDAARIERAELEREQRRSRSSLASERARLETAALRAAQDLERVGWLVARGALPAARLREARASAERSDETLRAHEIAVSVQRRTHERELRAAAAAIERLELRLAEARAALEVRAVVTGRIAAIRVVGGDRSGLEVDVIVER